MYWRHTSSAGLLPAPRHVSAQTFFSVSIASVCRRATTFGVHTLSFGTCDVSANVFTPFSDEK